MCNHRPYVKHVADQLKALSDEYMSQGVSVVAISSNDAVKYPEDSLATTEKAERGYAFAYLYDESQQVAQDMQPPVRRTSISLTVNRNLLTGDSWTPAAPTVTSLSLGRTCSGNGRHFGGDHLLSNNPSIGCNIKWKREMNQSTSTHKGSRERSLSARTDAPTCRRCIATRIAASTCSMVDRPAAG